MELIELARCLIDIESITGNEQQVGKFLLDYLGELASRWAGSARPMPVEPGRFNVLAQFGEPLVTLSTHQDTVPPFIPAREDDEYLWGRGACDVKGTIAAMIKAAEELLQEGTRDFALLFVVGEEKNSAGARVAAQQPVGSRYLVDGEPTENKLAIGSKGALRYQLVARGRMAHSAYPELGESAIEKLLDVLQDLRQMPLPADPLLGPSTLNIGTIHGGRAPNVIPDYAEAEILIRLVDDGAGIREAVTRLAQGRVELQEVICVPAVKLGTLDGFETTVVAFTTDIPVFGNSWGEPFLIGPGSIHLAHTEEERVRKQDLVEAVGIYKRIVRELQARARQQASRPLSPITPEI